MSSDVFLLEEGGEKVSIPSSKVPEKELSTRVSRLREAGEEVEVWLYDDLSIS
jgi:hypothetical protein